MIVLRPLGFLASLLIATLAPACGDDGPTGQTAGHTSSSGSTSSDPSTTGSADSTSGPATSTSEADVSTGPGGSSTDDPTTGGVHEDLDMSPEDFVCLLDWDQVRRFRITNLLGRLPEALEVANSPTGGTYPVGTVIQLIPNEAMVKRAEGWAPETNDWEFFSLATSAAGTEILERGTTRVVNQFGGNCFGCHSEAEPQWDLVCEQDHGCAPIPIGPDLIEMLQNGDPRCP